MFDLELLDARIRNSGCIESADIDFQNQGFVLLRGENLDGDGRSNGSGKSTLLDIISLLAVDEAGKNDGKMKENDYLPLWGGGNLEQHLRYRRAGHLYEVGHYRKHKTEGTRLTLSKDGILQSDNNMSIAHVKAEIAKTIGITPREWFGSVYLAQQRSHALVNGTPKEKRDYLAAHFGLDSLDACIKVNEKWINGIVLPDMSALSELLATCEEQIATIPNADVLASDRAGLQTKALDLSARLVQAGVEIQNHERARGAEEERKTHIRALTAAGFTLDHATKEVIGQLQDQIRAAEAAVLATKQRQAILDQLDTYQSASDSPEPLRAEFTSKQTRINEITALSTKVKRRKEVEATAATLPPVVFPEGDVEAIVVNLRAYSTRVGLVETRVSILNQEISKLRQLTDKCPMCLREVSAAERDAWITERETTVAGFNNALPVMKDAVANLEREKAEIERAVAAANQLALRHSILNDELATLPVGDLDALTSEFQDLSTRTSALTSEIALAATKAQLLTQLSSIHVPPGAENIIYVPTWQDQIRSLNAAREFVIKHGDTRFSEEGLALAQQQHRALLEEHQKVNEQLVVVTAQVTERTRLEQQAKDIRTSINKHSTEKTRRRVLEVLQVVLKDVKGKALRDCTEMIRSALPIYVRHLFRSNDIAVDLDEDEDAIDFYLNSQNQRIAMKLLSGGERKRIGLAILFAFAKLGAKTSNVLIADEPYTDLDVQGREAAFELFGDLGIPSIFITSHDQDQSREKRYDKVLVMRKQNGRARLVQGDSL